MDMDMDVYNPLDLQDLPIENKEWLTIMNYERGMFHSMGAPVSQVFAVMLHCNSFDQHDTCEVYGHITIEDVYGTSFELYRVDSDDPETLTAVQNTLSIYLPCECAVSYEWARMVIRLFDRADGSPIVDNVLHFNKLVIEDFDRLKIQRIDGARGHALVSFVTFSKADLAFVKFKIVRNDQENDLPVPPCLSGRIVARYGNTYGQKYPGIMLFNEPSNQPTTVEFGTPLELSRDMVIVPAYSFLRIDVALFDSYASKSLGYHKAEFLATDFSMYAWSNIEAGDFIIRVDVEWFHPYEVVMPLEKQPKRLKVFRNQQVRNISSEPFVKKCDPHGFSLLEVFSVMIGHNSRSVLNMCGTVRVVDNRTDHCVFNRSKSNPETVSPKSQTILMEGPYDCCFRGPEALVMELDLHDVCDEVLIKGNLFWNCSAMDVPISWYNKRICSVCRGINGYAAIFYTQFSRAVQALVEVSLISRVSTDTSHHRVNGTIVASYYNEDYSSEYESSYYKSVLFDKIENNCPLVKSGSKIPLLKPVVAVPIDASLVVEVDLYANSVEEHWKEALAIDIEDIKDPICGRIKGWSAYDMLVFRNQQVRNISREPFVKKCDPHGFSLLEVFSVMIGHSSRSVLNMCGTVRVVDNRTDHCVFNRSKSNPETVSPKSQTILMEGPYDCCFRGPESLVMELDLHDVCDEVLIKGNLFWNRSAMDAPISWYNRRICSVCRGINGYAAIFYTQFSRAVQALVEVSLISRVSTDTSHHRVNGTIVASYYNEDYSSEYESSYYKSVLLDKIENNCPLVKSGSKIPLLKPVVAVPIDASLVVEVDLYANSVEEHWKEALAIDIEDIKDPICGRIKGKNYHIELSVVWSKLDELYP